MTGSAEASVRSQMMISLPATQMRMPVRLPAAPSQTATMTPLTSTSSAKLSVLVGTFFSIATASTAVTTGMADLHACNSPQVHTSTAEITGRFVAYPNP